MEPANQGGYTPVPSADPAPRLLLDVTGASAASDDRAAEAAAKAEAEEPSDTPAVPSPHHRLRSTIRYSLTADAKQTLFVAGKAMRVLRRKANCFCTVDETSVYGCALALPQLARTADWSIFYTGLAVRSLVFLVTNLFLQGFLLYMITKEEQVIDKFSGQMFLCDFGANLYNCPGGPNCVGPDGTKYTPERIYDWSIWTTRMFVRDSLLQLFPDRADEINEKIDPGEYGLESYYLRMASCFLFVLGLWGDLAGSFEMLELLYFLPSEPEPWMQLDDNAPEDPELLSLDFVQFKVAGMPLHWKIFNFVVVWLPKMYLWALTVDSGMVFLMETSRIDEMIINAVALAFILNIDELLMSVMSPECKDMMSRLEGFQKPQDESPHYTMQEEFEHHERERKWTPLTPQLYKSVFPIRLFGMLSVTAFFISKYYYESCVQLPDGSYVSQDIKLPDLASLDVWTFLFRPLPGFFPVQTAREAIWEYQPQFQSDSG